MSARVASVLLAALVAVTTAQAEYPGAAKTAWNFDADTVDAPPRHFVFGRTGSGRPGRWIVRSDAGAPSGANVLAQVDPDDTDYRFPVAVVDNSNLRDLRLSVKCKPVSGKVDQACGLVFRYRDENNYYLTRANALEDNVNLYYVKDGRRKQIAGWRGITGYITGVLGGAKKVSSGTWHELAIEADGDHFEVYWDANKVIDAHDSTFAEEGKIGLWTKADSVTYFDNLSAELLGIGAQTEGGGGLHATACAYVTSFGGEDVCGVHVPDGGSLGCAHTGAKPHGVALSPDGDRVYVSNEGSDSVTVVDAATMRAVSQVKVGHEPNQVALSPSGDRLWVTNHGDSTVSVINTVSLAVDRTIPVGREPHVIVTNAARNVAIVTAEGDDALDLFDLATFERVSHIPVFGFPRVLAATSNGDTAFLTIRWLNGALVVDLLGNGPRERIALGEPQFAPEGKDAHGIALTNDGRTVLITTQMTDELTFVDAKSLAVLDRVHVGRNPNWAGVTADGRYAVVSTTDDDSASIVELATRKVIAVAHVGHQPKRLAVGACPRGLRAMNG